MINYKIRAKEVRLVGEHVEPGVYPIEEALKFARKAEKDLVLISNKAVPVVCKIIDYAKFKYQEKQKEKRLKKNNPKTDLKEIRFRRQTKEHDQNFKKKHAEAFLKKGSKVKITIQFSGRERQYRSEGFEILQKFAEDLATLSKIEMPPKMEGGSRVALILSPIGQKKKSSS